MDDKYKMTIDELIINLRIRAEVEWQRGIDYAANYYPAQASKHFEEFARLSKQINQLHLIISEIS